MKIRSDFVTNSSSTTYLVVYGGIEMGLCSKEVVLTILRNILLDEYNYDGDFVNNLDLVNVDVGTSHGVAIYNFCVAIGIPYSISIQQVENDMREFLLSSGLTVLSVSSDVEERWD